ISELVSAVTNAERRAIACCEDVVVPGFSDVYAAQPAITGKLELEYEGELVGAERIARDLVARAAADTFLARGGEAAEEAVEEVVEHFDRGGVLQVADTAAAHACLEGFRAVPGLLGVIETLGLAHGASPGHIVAGCELVLEALVAERRISRSEAGRYTRAPRRQGPPHGPGFGKPSLEV